jgi:hypothetical protein
VAAGDRHCSVEAASRREPPKDLRHTTWIGAARAFGDPSFRANRILDNEDAHCW